MHVGGKIERMGTGGRGWGRGGGKMQGGVSRIPNDEGRRLSEGEASSFPQGGVIVFPWKGLALLRKSGWGSVMVYPSPGNPASIPPDLSPQLPTPDSPHTAPDCAALPLSDPRAIGWECKTCALAP